MTSTVQPRRLSTGIIIPRYSDKEQDSTMPILPASLRIDITHWDGYYYHFWCCAL